MEGTVKLDKWGYEVRTSSDVCISAINAFYIQVWHAYISIYYVVFLFFFVGNLIFWIGFLWNLNLSVLKVLSFGRERSVILEAPSHDKDCVLANVYAAHFLYSSDSPRASLYLEAAKSSLVMSDWFVWSIFDSPLILIFLSN